jgi:hypothetical protein
LFHVELGRRADAESLVGQAQQALLNADVVARNLDQLLRDATFYGRCLRRKHARQLRYRGQFVCARWYLADDEQKAPASKNTPILKNSVGTPREGLASSGFLS